MKEIGCLSRLHDVACLKSPFASAIQFVGLHTIPIPWEEFLTSYERHVAELCCILCDRPWYCNWDCQFDLTGKEQWNVHCHCPRPYSLQCWSQNAVVCEWLKEILIGMCYDSQFWFYRFVVNKDLPREIQYVGSYFCRGVHFIYLSFSRGFYFVVNRSRISFGEHRIYLDPFYVVVICRSCKNLSEISARCCARRIRRLLKKSVGYLLKREHRLTSFGHHEKKASLILRLYRYDIPINMVNDLDLDF